jgi:hypothetical protein
MLDFLSGGGPSDDTRAAHSRWGYIAKLFLMCVNKENGTLAILPEAGGLLDQPARTMSVFELMQGIFLERVNQINKRR